MRDVLGIPMAAMRKKWLLCELGKAEQELFSAGQILGLTEAGKPTLGLFNAFARLEASIRGSKWIRLLEDAVTPIAPRLALRSERLATVAGRSAHSRLQQVLHDAIEGVSVCRTGIESVVAALGYRRNDH